MKLEAPPPAPVLKKKSQSKKPIPKERALVVVKAPARPRPRRLKGSRPSLLPIVFKLLVGVGVASAAVAMQDRFPQFESRGSAVTTGTDRTTNPVQPQAQARRSSRPSPSSRRTAARSPAPPIATTAAASSPPAPTAR